MKSDIRRRVATEAARLLYNGVYAEYIHAKEAASSSLGVKVVPSNFEVAEELDRLVDSLEGDERWSRLIQLRTKALELMKLLQEYNPVLTGSVWRGTARRGSDIDINVYSPDPNVIERLLVENGCETRIEEVNVTRSGVVSRSTHISFDVDSDEVEVVVRPMEDAGKHERCGTYGDLKKGLTLGELERVMQGDPLRRFVPKKRAR